MEVLCRLDDWIRIWNEGDLTGVMICRFLMFFVLFIYSFVVASHPSGMLNLGYVVGGKSDRFLFFFFAFLFCFSFIPFILGLFVILPLLLWSVDLAAQHKERMSSLTIYTYVPPLLFCSCLSC